MSGWARQAGRCPWASALRRRAASSTSRSRTAGWHDSWQRRGVTRRWEDWREEVPWMSLYLSAAVWLSLAIAAVPPDSADEHRGRRSTLGRRSKLPFRLGQRCYLGGGQVQLTR